MHLPIARLSVTAALDARRSDPWPSGLLLVTPGSIGYLIKHVVVVLRGRYLASLSVCLSTRCAPRVDGLSEAQAIRLHPRDPASAGSRHVTRGPVLHHLSGEACNPKENARRVLDPLFGTPFGLLTGLIV